MTHREGDRAPHARRLRGGRFSVPWQTYCVTKCVQGRRPILAHAQAAELVIGSLAQVRGEDAIKLLAFVIMPDHYHAIFTLLPGTELAAVMRRIGSFTGNQIRAILGRSQPVWQADGFHDHACRNDREVLDLTEYIHHNPVRKGLVSRAEDWPFSSAHLSRRHLLDWEWWLGRAEVRRESPS